MREYARNQGTVPKTVLEGAPPARALLVVLEAVAAARLVVAVDVLGVALGAAKDEMRKLGGLRRLDEVGGAAQGLVFISGALDLLLPGVDHLLLVPVLGAPAVALAAFLAELSLEVADLVELALELFNAIFEVIGSVLLGSVLRVHRPHLLLGPVKLLEASVG